MKKKETRIGSRQTIYYPFQEPLKEMFIDPWNNKVLMRYLNDLESWHKYIRFLGMPTTQEHKDVPAEKLFVPPRFANRYIKPSEQEPDKEQELFDLGQLLEKHPRAFVLGDPGSGKSTLVDWITTRFCKQTEEAKALGPLIPFPMVLREMKLGDVETFGDLIDAFLSHEKCAALRENRKLVETLLESGQAFLMLDGLDEVANRKLRVNLLNAISDLFNRGNKQVRWLLTTRIIGFDQLEFFDFKDVNVDINERIANSMVDGIIDYKAENILNLNWRSGTMELWPEIYLSPFTDRQIGEFAHKWYKHAESNKTRAKQDAEELKTAVHSNPNVLALSRTPNLLTLIALLHRISAVLPADRHKLYKELTEAYLVKIEQTKRRKETSYKLEEHHQWLAVLGWEFQQQRGEEDEGVMMDFGEIKDILLKAMRGTPEHEDATDENVEQYLDYVCRRSGILVPRSDEQYAFTHLSFQEYYAAQYLKLRLQWAQSEASFGDNPQPLKEFKEELADFFHTELWWETLYLFFKSFEADKSALPFLFKKAFEREKVPGFVYIYYSDFKPYLKPDLEQKIKHEPTLELNYPQLQKLDFVELCDNLKELNLNQTVVSDLSPLSGLSSLVRLYLNQTVVSDLSPLSGLSSLGWLYLSQTGVSDLSPLSGLSSLETLYLSQTGVSDLSPLSGLSSFRVLDLSQTGVSDLSPLSGLTSLRVLYLSQTGVSDLSPLSGLTSLGVLDLSQTGVSDLSPLSGLSSFRVLDLSQTGVSDLSPLSGLSSLERLNLNQTGVSDLSPLSGLTSLGWLDLSQTGVSDLSPLSGLSSLESLYLSQTGVSDLSPLSGLTSLRVLYLSQTGVSDLSPLSGLTSLGVLDLSQTGVSDLSPLSGLTSLGVLDLSQTGVSDLSPLSGLTSLEWLYLSQTGVSDLSPLPEGVRVIGK